MSEKEREQKPRRKVVSGKPEAEWKPDSSQIRIIEETVQESRKKKK